MDGGILSLIILSFKSASEHWATSLVNLLEPAWFVLVRLAFVLLIIAAWFERSRGLAILCVGVLWLGFTHTLFVRGWEWADSLSHGVRVLSAHLGAPAYDPSAIIQLGAHVAKPLMEATSNQGTLSFITRMWAGGAFVLAGFAMFAAFAILAFVQFALLLMNYLLIGGAPFFLMWLLLPGVNALTILWIRLMTGTLAGLFACGLIAGIMNDFGQQMADRYQAVFANAVGSTTLTWADWGGPLGTALVLAAAFAWIPLKFAREAAGVAGDLWSAGGMALSLGASALSLGSSSSGGGGGGSTSSGGNSQNTTLALPAPNAGGHTGGSMGPAQQPANSQWGRTRP